MSIKESTIPFYQTPKFLDDIPGITGDHIWIFNILYDQLRQTRYQEIGYNKTNQYLSEKTNCGLSKIKLKINDLEKWGLLRRKGFGSKRKFYLGRLFYRSESGPVQKQYRSESDPIQVVNQPSNWSESEPHNKNSNNNLTNPLSLKEEKPDCSNYEQEKTDVFEEVDRLEKLIDTELRYLNMMKKNPTNPINQKVISSTAEKIERLKSELEWYKTIAATKTAPTELIALTG